jgi:hypothetical protein
VNDFSNGRHYQRRYADPRKRPSNQRVDLVVEVSRQSVAQVARMIDEIEAEREGTVLAEAWSVLHPKRPRMRMGDPGE